MSFIDDIQGKNTQLYPIVTIEPPDLDGNWIDKFNRCKFLSTNNVFLGFVHANDETEGTPIPKGSLHNFQPLLLNIPSIKESIDIESRKFKISNVSLDISNYEHGGRRFTDILSDTSLINWLVSIQFVSPTANIFSTIYPVTNDTGDWHGNSFYTAHSGNHNGTYIGSTYYEAGQSYGYSNTAMNQRNVKLTQMVYQGVIRRISHDDEKVKVELEDLTEKKAHKDLPSISIGTGAEILDKYKGKPFPLVYGAVDRSPLPLIAGEIVPAYHGIHSINGLYIGNNTGYSEVLASIDRNFDDAWLGGIVDDLGENKIEYLAGDTQYIESAYSDSNIDYAKSINISEGILFPSNLIQVGGTVGIKDLLIPSGQSANSQSYTAIPKMSLLVDELKKINDGDVSTYGLLEGLPSGDVDDDNATFFVYHHIKNGNYPFDFFDFNHNLIEGGEVIGSEERASLHEIKSFNGYSLWELWHGAGTVPSVFNEERMIEAGWLSTDEWVGLNGNDFFGLFTTNYNEFTAGHRDFWINVQIKDSDGVFWDIEETIGIGNPSSNLLSNANWLLPFPVNNGDLGILISTSNTAETYRFDYEFKMRSAEIEHVGNVKGVNNKDFYANVKGRVNTFFDHPDSSLAPDYEDWNNYTYQLIENPIDIIYDLVRSELGHNAIDEAEYAEARAAHLDWKFGFTVNKKISSKKLIEDIAKSTKCFPKFKNDGTFGFNTIKDTYDVDSDYEKATLIKEPEVISYSFKKTKPEQIYKKVTVSYNKDYAQDSYLESTEIDLLGDPYYGIEDSADAHLDFESDYIRHSADDGETANKLASFLSEQYKNDHLLFNLKLPLQYIDLEIGDLVKFRELFGGVKAYGIDYRRVQYDNNQWVLPLFMVTSTTKNLDSISIECMQLHHLLFDTSLDGFSETATSSFDTGFFDLVEGGTFYFPDAEPIAIEPDISDIFAPDVENTYFVETDYSIQTDNLFVHKLIYSSPPRTIYRLVNKDLVGFDMTEYDGIDDNSPIFQYNNIIQIKSPTHSTIVRFGYISTNSSNWGGEQHTQLRGIGIPSWSPPPLDEEALDSFMKPEGWQEGEPLQPLEITLMSLAPRTESTGEDDKKDIVNLMDKNIW